jgi:hypothetical protein
MQVIHHKYYRSINIFVIAFRFVRLVSELLYYEAIYAAKAFVVV